MRRYAQGSIALVLPRGEKVERRSVSRAVLGAEIDRVRLGALLARGSGFLRRNVAGRARTGERSMTLPIAGPASAGGGLAALLKLKDEMDRAPLDARFDLETKRLLPEQAGVWVDVYGTLARLDAAMVDGVPEVEVAFDTQSLRASSPPKWEG